MSTSQEQRPDHGTLPPLTEEEGLQTNYTDRLSQHLAAEGMSLAELRESEPREALETLDGFIRADTVGNASNGRQAVLLPRQFCKLHIRDYLQHTAQAPRHRDKLVAAAQPLVWEAAQYFPQIVTAAQLQSEQPADDRLRDHLTDLLTVYGQTANKVGYRRR